MNCKPEKSPRFAVDRALMLSRLPGVRLAANANVFARGRPRLESDNDNPFVRYVRAADVEMEEPRHRFPTRRVH